MVAESVLVRHELLILNRGRKRAPNLRAADRFMVGLCTLFICRARLLRSAIVLKPSTLLHLHQVLTRRKYRLLFSPKGTRRPGPKGPAKELIDAVVEMKRRNPGWGCPRIAQQIAMAFRVGNRQGWGPPHSELALPARSQWRRSLLAHLPRPDEGQPVELRFVSL